LVPSKCSREVEIVSPIDAVALVVATRLDSQRDARPIGDQSDRDQKAPIDLQAIGRNRINLICGVRLFPKAFCCAPRTDAEHGQHTAPPGNPFALNP
jgi:hypothetical protein